MGDEDLNLKDYGARAGRVASVEISQAMDAFEVKRLRADNARLRDGWEAHIFGVYREAYDCGDHCPAEKQLNEQGAQGLAECLSEIRNVEVTVDEARAFYLERIEAQAGR